MSIENVIAAYKETKVLNGTVSEPLKSVLEGIIEKHEAGVAEEPTGADEQPLSPDADSGGSLDAGAPQETT